MWKWKKKQVVDERIRKESNKFNAKMYYLLTGLMVVLLIVKLFAKVEFSVYLLDVTTLLAGVVYLLVAEIRKGILFVKEKDEVLTTLHEENLSNAMYVEFFIVIFGEVLYLLVLKEHFLWLPAYFLVWMPPALIYTIAAIKNGWLIWGTKKRENEGKKDFKKRVVIGSLFYGVFVGWTFLFKDGVFRPEGILWILGLAAMWGIPFYFIMMGFMKAAEKNADKKLSKEEERLEE